MGGQKGVQNEPKTKTRRKKKADRTPGDRARISQPGGGGAWRAFVSIHGRGYKLTGALSSRLSARYKRLTAAQKAFYAEMGLLGTERHRIGAKTFPHYLHAAPPEPKEADDDAGGI